MLEIEVEMLHGVFRGMGADDLGLAGEATEGEWPPSPARLFSALVAAGGTGGRIRVDGTGDELLAIENATPPVIFADGLDSVLQTPLVDRFVVIDKTESASNVQNYPGRSAQQVRGGVVTAMHSRFVRYRWEGLDFDSELLHCLRQRAARIGYFGCADSPARVRVRTGALADRQGDESRWDPSAGGSRALGVPTAGLLGRLDGAFENWSAGKPQRRAWISVASAGYGQPAIEEERAVVKIVRFDRAVNQRFTLLVAETARNALLRHFDALVGGRDQVPEVVHGHLAMSEGRQDHMYVAPLPFVGAPNADGKIRGVAFVLPKGTAPQVCDLVALAANRIERLVYNDGNRNIFNVAVGAQSQSATKGQWSTTEVRWRKPAKSWLSVTPVIVERRRKGGPLLDDIVTWCRNSGVSNEPVDFVWSPVPLIPGGASLMPHEVFRKRNQHRPYGHLAIQFDEPVVGPLLLGRGRHLGMGLMTQDGGGGIV